jgi:alkylation response protein AidB-like acyl-CoA dehydrogenase
VPVTPQIRVTDRGVKLAGMRAATTGSVDFNGVVVQQEALIGCPGDYLREPAFSTGAWRSSAVALGGLAALIDTARTELCSRGRADNPFQRMRFGQTVIAHETGRLWLLQAVKRVDSATADEAVAYVNLARTAVETACLDALRHIQRSLGLSAFMRGSKAERIARDLATYLRQPAPDEVLVEAAGYFIHHGFKAL